MKIEWGPPGHRGVTQIMGLGETTEPPAFPKLKTMLPQTEPLKSVGSIAILGWLAGALSGSQALKHLSIGAGVAVLAVQHFRTAGEAKKTIEVVDATVPLPTLNGWG